MPDTAQIIELEREIFDAVGRYGINSVVAIMVAICSLIAIATLFWKTIRNERSNYQDRREERTSYLEFIERVTKSQDTSIRELSEQTRIIATMLEGQSRAIDNSLQRLEQSTKEVREATSEHVRDSKERYNTANRLTMETNVDVKEVLKLVANVGARIDSLTSAIEHHSVSNKEIKTEVIAAREEFKVGVQSLLEIVRRSSD